MVLVDWFPLDTLPFIKPLIWIAVRLRDANPNIYFTEPPNLNRDYSSVQIYAYDPIIWIVIILRDPNICIRPSIRINGFANRSFIFGWHRRRLAARCRRQLPPLLQRDRGGGSTGLTFPFSWLLRPPPPIPRFPSGGSEPWRAPRIH